MDSNRNAKGKGAELWAADAMTVPSGPESPTTQIVVEWTKYEPPAGLRHAPNVKSEIVLKIITESIDTIKARIVKDAERHRAETEPIERRQTEFAPNSVTGTTVEGTSHRIVPATDLLRPQVRTSTIPEDNLGETPFLSNLPTRPNRTLERWFQLPNIRHERGESSSAGSLQRMFEPLLQGRVTHSPRKRSVLDRIKTNLDGGISRSPASSIHAPEVECVVCLGVFEPQDAIQGPCHSYCKPCFVYVVASACDNEQHWPPTCCLNVIPEHTILAYIDDKDLLSLYRDRAIEWNVPINDRLYCSEVSCGAFIPVGRIEEVQGFATCFANHKTCFRCRGPHHPHAACPHDRDRTKIEELAKSEGWKRCYGCGIFVEHRDACLHMTCRCGANFCYVCGSRWRTCQCTMAQLDAVKDQALARRQARLQREAQEELVDDAKREIERLTAVTAKYREVREILARLTSEQRTVVQMDHETCERKIRQSGEEKIQSLRDSHQGWENYRRKVELERLAAGERRDNELSFAKRKHAELRWMQEIFAERSLMLEVMEAEERKTH
ncbi:hypothetical protein F5Y18DRAFT_440170 [Xylariaceae sp. FL1019]|nr:hypothetical protein F5Y18DRAFT_440170 [Xylariaceae sp. FL1019]